MSEKIFIPESEEQGPDLYDGFIVALYEGELDFNELTTEIIYHIYERLLHYTEIVKYKNNPAEKPLEYLEANGLSKKLGIDIEDDSFAMMTDECKFWLSQE